MKRILSLLAAVLFLLSLCACQSSQKNATPMLAFVHRAGEDAYTTALAESFSKTAKQLGYDCTAVTPENDSAEDVAEETNADNAPALEENEAAQQETTEPETEEL